MHPSPIGFLYSCLKSRLNRVSRLLRCTFLLTLSPVLLPYLSSALATGAPWFTPGSGTYSYTGGINVQIFCSASGAAIHYTTDGSSPKTSSATYKGSIAVPPVSGTKTFKAICVSGSVASSSTTVVYTLTPPLPPPTYSPAPGTYVGTQAVSIASVKGAVIHYTTDGSAVSESSPVYKGPLTVAKTTSILSLAAAAPGYTTGSFSRGTYNIAVPTPIITPSSGTYATAPTIVMTDSLAGAAIFYTLDGSTPTSTSTRYLAPFALTTTKMGAKTVRAIATTQGLANSSVAQASLNLSAAAGVIATATVGTSPVTDIPSDFLGFAHDWPNAAYMMGTTSTGMDALYGKLVKNLTDNMNGPLVIRIGGMGTDTSGPATTATVQPFIDLWHKEPVKFLLGVNLGSDNLSLAKQQASTFVSNMPTGSLMGLEIGNEPDGYNFDGIRSKDYLYPSFLPEYQQWQSALSAIVPSGVGIEAPNFGGGWWDPFAAVDIPDGVLKADIVSQHAYLVCYDANILQPSDYLLQPSQAQIHFWSLRPYVKAVRAFNLPFRITELNSLCLGGQPGVSDNFTSALWGVDTMFEMANIGVTGVNWMTAYGGAAYDLFQIAIKTVNNGQKSFQLLGVRPAYYGLLFFSRAAGHNAQLYPASAVTNGNVKIWVTKDDTGKAHLILLNKDESASGNVQVTLPGYSSGQVTRLTAASGFTAKTGVTFGGQTFDGSTDGSIQGSVQSESITPNGNVWTVSVPKTSAALVDLEP